MTETLRSPTLRRIAWLKSGIAFALVTGSSYLLAAAAGLDAALKDIAVAQAEVPKIVKSELLPSYWTARGYKVPPRQIAYDENAQLAKLDEKWSTLWKQIQLAISQEYESRQAELNNKLPRNKQLRPVLRGAFQGAVELRGGGSASASLHVYSGAHTEWILANIPETGQVAYLSDDELARQLKEQFQDLSDRPLSDYKQAVGRLRKLEPALNKQQAAFVRAEFLKYFNDEE